MDNNLKEQLIDIAREKQTKKDPSHDFQHVLRVYNLAMRIGKEEGVDFDILIPAALFHDIIVYRKDHPNSKKETEQSARVAKRILNGIESYPKEKIELVAICITQCSFSKGIKPNLLEAKILQDADRLEATGAISIMRTFSSGGQMNRQFYNSNDPFYKEGVVEFDSNVALFYKRLLVVEKGMHTKFAKKIARKRTIFLYKFLCQLKSELTESGII